MSGAVDVWLSAVSAIPPVEWLGVVLAAAYLVLAVRQNVWCWSFAAASSLVYLWVFVRAALPMQAVLQIFYVVMAVYGWRQWRGSPSSARGSRPVVRWPPVFHVAAIVVVTLVALVNVRLLGQGATPAPGIRAASGAVAFVDAWVAWASVVTTWLVARKVLENWLYWIAIDLTAAGLYWHQGLYATSGLFVVYAIIAVRGYASWRASEAAGALVTSGRA